MWLEQSIVQDMKFAFGHEIFGEIFGEILGETFGAWVKSPKTL